MLLSSACSPHKRITRVPLRRPAQPEPLAADLLVYTLTGGGPGVGRRAMSGGEARIAQLCARGWVVLECVLACGAVQRVSWRRSHLRRRLPYGTLCAAPPSREELAAELRAAQQPQRHESSSAPAPARAASPSAASLAPPPPPPPQLKLAADTRCVVVLFDTERYGYLIHDMAATALVRVQTGRDSAWVVPAGALGRFSAKAAACVGADDAVRLIDWLMALSEAVRAGASGAPPDIVMLAHGGPGSDWPPLTALLMACGLSLPRCVAGLGCSRHLFVAEKERSIGGYWGMKNLFAVRFGGKSIEAAHTAVGDVRCAMPAVQMMEASAALCTDKPAPSPRSAMELIFMDVVKKNGHSYVEQAALQRSDAAPPHEYEERHAVSRMCDAVRSALRDEAAMRTAATAR